MKQMAVAVLGVLLMTVAGVRGAEPLPVAIAPDDAKLQYIGRFDRRDPAGPRCEWSHSTVRVRFRGTDLQVRLSEAKDNYWAVAVDDGPATTLKTAKGEQVVDLARGLPDGEHTVSLVRRTEAFVGRSQIRGFYLNEGGTLLDPRPAERRIEVIGDSISCGYGNEGASIKEKFSPATENAYMTYGAIAARELGADYVCIAWSGKKMAPDNTLGEIYDRVLPTDKNSKHDFAGPAPDVVVINLSTNDFNKGNPEQEIWTSAYRDFVLRVREHYPKAHFYMTTSPMMHNGGERKARTTLMGYLEQVQKALREQTGDAKNFRIIDFPQQKQEHGIGSDWHPSIKTHEVMARRLADTLKADLGWETPAGTGAGGVE